MKTSPKQATGIFKKLFLIRGSGSSRDESMLFKVADSQHAVRTLIGWNIAVKVKVKMVT